MTKPDEKLQARGGDMDAPDRIWAWTELDVDGAMWGAVQKFWISNPDVRTGEETEYVRADLMAELTSPVAVHVNMLRGTIAKPTVDHIIHLYGVDALVKALAPVIVREADKLEYERKVSQMKEDFPNGI